MGAVAKVLIVIGASGILGGVFLYAVPALLNQDIPTPVRNQPVQSDMVAEKPDGCCSSSGGCCCATKGKSCCCTGGKPSATPASPAVRASGLVGSFLANPLAASALLSGESDARKPLPSPARASGLVGSLLLNDPLTASALLSGEAGNTKQMP